MQSRCAKHLFEGAEDRCGKCGAEFCGECLVYAFGPKKPPMCIPCAVQAAGIRASAGNRPTVAKSEMKRLQKERSSAFKRFRRGRSTPPAVIDEPTPTPATEPSPSPTTPAFPAPSPLQPLADESFAPAPPPADAPSQVPSPPAGFPDDGFGDDTFVTEPAYVDPSPSTMPIPGG